MREGYDKVVSDLHAEARRLKNMLAEMKLVGWNSESGTVPWELYEAMECVDDAAKSVEQAADKLVQPCTV